MSVVSLVRISNSSLSRTAVEKAVDMIGFKINTNVHKIVIKPNMCYYLDYSTGETTDPLFVAEIIEFLRDSISSNLEISVVESDASAMKCAYSFRFLGYEKMTKGKDVRLINLTQDSKEIAKVKVANRELSFSFPSTLRNADLIVNVPKMKYMANVQFSGALKNMFGCNPYPQKFRYHAILDEVIVGLNKLMKPSLSLLDGIVVRGMSTRRLGLVMASMDSVAMDSTAAKILGFEPKHVRHIALAEKEGLGSTNFQTVGESLNTFMRRFPRRSTKNLIFHSRVARLAWSTLSKINRDNV